MRGGRLRHQVTVQQATHAQDAYGATTETWSTYVQAWAGVEPIRGTERFEAAKNQAQADTKIVMRYRSGITPAMRVLFGSRIFDIQSVIEPNTRRRELHLMCKEYFGDSQS